MSALNQFLSDNLAILVVVGMIAIVVTLVVIAKRQPIDTTAQVTIDLSDQIDQLRRAAEHHADVSAVVAMVRQLDGLDEGAIELLKSYPENVRAAAWLHYINTLGSDLQAAQEALSHAHTGKDPWYNHSGVGSQVALIDGRQRHVDNLRVKLDAAIAASGQTRLRTV